MMTRHPERDLLESYRDKCDENVKTKLNQTLHILINEIKLYYARTLLSVFGLLYL